MFRSFSIIFRLSFFVSFLKQIFFLNFVPALTNIYYIHLFMFSIFLTLCPCITFKKYTGTSKFPFLALYLAIPSALPSSCLLVNIYMYVLFQACCMFCQYELPLCFNNPARARNKIKIYHFLLFQPCVRSEMKP
jgi:hypothetical protein